MRPRWVMLLTITGALALPAYLPTAGGAEVAQAAALPVSPLNVTAVATSPFTAYAFGSWRPHEDLANWSVPPGIDLSRAVVRYDALFQRATVVAQMPEPIDNVAAVHAGASIYLFGGGFQEPSRSIYQFNVSDHSFHLLAKDALPVGLTRMAAVWLDGAAYLFGGLSADRSGALAAESSILEFRPSLPEGLRLRTLPYKLPYPVDAAAAAVVGKEIWIFGGNVPRSAIPCGLSERTYPYSACPSSVVLTMNASGFPRKANVETPYPISFASAAAVGDNVYLLGGMTLNATGSVPSPELLRFDAKTRAFSRTDAIVYAPSQGSAVASGRSLLVFGGVTPENYYNNLVLRVFPNLLPVPSLRLARDGLNVTADASASEDPDGEIVQLAWEWGDGGSAVGPSARHEYAKAGTYEIRLTAVDDFGESSMETTTVKVGRPPVADVRIRKQGLHVAASGAGSASPDGSISVYRWDWGDGATSTGVEASHDYAFPGTYEVRLEVEDDVGSSASTSRQVRAHPPPQPAFRWVAEGMRVRFDASETTAEGGVARLEWDFGDGRREDAGWVVNHTYGRPGSFSVQLRAIDGEGVDASETQAVTIEAPAPIGLGVVLLGVAAAAGFRRGGPPGGRPRP